MEGKIYQLERLLVAHCAPTLAGIKTGNLFNFAFSSAEELTFALKDANRRLEGKGIRIELLRVRGRSALVLAYRPSRLMQDLKNKAVEAFLKENGYEAFEVDYAVSRLKKRFGEQSCFPHEIGLFLGYPLMDVIGFIENRGKNSKCTGCWKVYCDEEEAVARFRKYRKCREVYLKMFAGGCPIVRLAVAA